MDFARPQSVFNSELNETSPDPILGGLFQKERSSNVKRGKSKTHKREGIHEYIINELIQIEPLLIWQSEDLAFAAEQKFDRITEALGCCVN